MQTKIILLERIAKLGQLGDVVKVKAGYARNFLLPKGKALRANKTNIAYFETQKKQLEARNLELKSDAEKLAEKVRGKIIVAIRQAGDSGQLYGSVSGRDIVELLASDGLQIEKNQVKLQNPIKNIGLHEIGISLHAEVEIKLTINVARSKDEARAQEKGEDTSGDDDDKATGRGKGKGGKTTARGKTTSGKGKSTRGKTTSGKTTSGEATSGSASAEEIFEKKEDAEKFEADKQAEAAAEAEAEKSAAAVDADSDSEVKSETDSDSSSAEKKSDAADNNDEEKGEK